VNVEVHRGLVFSQESVEVAADRFAVNMQPRKNWVGIMFTVVIQC
jgi:hypothetical protein